MKKKMICLMIACLSLFAYPYQLNAGALLGPKDKTELPILPVLTPAMEKKVNEFKKNHPEMFTKKENQDIDTKTQNAQKAMGFIMFISGTMIIVILILLLIFL